jgi:hypothetical protein
MRVYVSNSHNLIWWGIDTWVKVTQIRTSLPSKPQQNTTHVVALLVWLSEVSNFRPSLHDAYSHHTRYTAAATALCFNVICLKSIKTLPH